MLYVTQKKTIAFTKSRDFDKETGIPHVKNHLEEWGRVGEWLFSCSFFFPLFHSGANVIDYSYGFFISTSDQRCFIFGDQRWNNVDPTLKIKQNLTSDFQRCTTLMERRCQTFKQRWYIFISTLFQRVLSISKSYIKTSRASDKYRFVNLYIDN